MIRLPLFLLYFQKQTKKFFSVAFTVNATLEKRCVVSFYFVIEFSEQSVESERVAKDESGRGRLVVFYMLVTSRCVAGRYF